MRKNSPRKWLHAVLDLLPVILIPVFMVYSHRHEINSGSIEVQEKQVIDFNQLMQPRNGSADGTNYNVVYNGYTLTTTISSERNLDFYYYDYVPRIWIENHKIYAKPIFSSDVGNIVQIVFGGNGSPIPYIEINSNNSLGQIINVLWSSNDNTNKPHCVMRFTNALLNDYSIGLQIYDLTQMYGVGNEPTIEEFNQQFNDNIYDYTLSHKELVDGELVTYNDTDIMSQFTYQLYNAVDKYFNMGNVFNMNGVYDWFNLNIFNGSAPIYIYVVWQIVLYEFVMDLLFLLYGLFMWFIDMVEHIMNKPFKSIK